MIRKYFKSGAEGIRWKWEAKVMGIQKVQKDAQKKFFKSGQICRKDWKWSDQKIKPDMNWVCYFLIDLTSNGILFDDILIGKEKLQSKLLNENKIHSNDSLHITL